MNQRIMDKLRQKKTLFLHEHLQEAVINGRVLSKYEPLQPQFYNETADEYINRLRNSASIYQFVSVKSGNGKQDFVSFGVSGPIITEYGDFFVIPAEVVGGRWGVHYVLFYKSYNHAINRKEITIRIDSGCFSGMVLGDITCDCLQQLRLAQKTCSEKKEGIIIEIPGHDGRGWGEYKMANQKIMKDLGYDTIKTAEKFYGQQESIDVRNYEEAVLILKALGFNKEHLFNLATSNPFKIKAFKKHGLQIENVAAVVSENASADALRNIKAKEKYWQQFKK